MLSDETQYSLDCSSIAGDIPYDAYIYLSYLKKDTEKWFDGIMRARDPWNEFLVKFGMESRSELMRWRELAHWEDRCVLTWSGLEHLKSMPLEEAFKEFASHILKEVYRKNGPMNERTIAKRCREEEYDFDNSKFVGLVVESTSRLSEDVRTFGFDDVASCRGLVDEKIGEWRNSSLMEPCGCVVRDLQIPKKTKKAKRKPIVKAWSMMESIVGKETTKACMSGEEIKIEGRNYIFRTRYKVMSSIGHGGMDITVTDKNHVELTNLCFYFEDMPAPDQIAALIMHVRAGDEEKILKTANFTTMTESGRRHEGLNSIKRQTESVDLRLAGTLARRVDPMDSHIDRVLFDGVTGTSSFMTKWRPKVEELLRIKFFDGLKNTRSINILNHDYDHNVLQFFNSSV